MVYREGLLLGLVMLATGLLAAWLWFPWPVGDDEYVYRYGSGPDRGTMLAFLGGATVALIGAAVAVLSLLE